jgi:hypothetical protein
MRRRRATLSPMDLQRLLADVLDVIDAQAGDWDAVEAVLRDRYDGEELAMALDTYAASFLWAYEEPGGPAFLRGMRDRRRRLVPAHPAGAPGRGFLRRRPA